MAQLNVPKKPCAAPGCGALVARGYCVIHAERAISIRRQYDADRGHSARRGYDKKWRTFRAWFLVQPENVICADCGERPSMDVHHVRKVRDFPQLRLEPSNCRGLCHGCHSARTLRGE